MSELDDIDARLKELGRENVRLFGPKDDARCTYVQEYAHGGFVMGSIMHDLSADLSPAECADRIDANLRAAE